MDEEQVQEVLQIIKTRIDLDGSKDALIETYIQEIGRRILHYCQIRDVPADLNWTWASMVIDTLRVDQPDQFGSGDIEGLNIKIGDTNVSSASGNSGGVTTTNKTVIDQIVFNYMADLRRWRKLRW